MRLKKLHESFFSITIFKNCKEEMTMKKSGFTAIILLVLCACVPQRYQGTVDTVRDTGRAISSRVSDADEFSCSRSNTLPVKSRQLYENYYGTILTSDTAWLRTPGGKYRWGIANSKPLSLAHFGAYVKPLGKYGRFRAKVYIDQSIKADMVFTFRAESYNGEVLRNLPISPGATKTVDIDIAGVKKLYIGADLRINHDRAEKIVIGEPEFYSCR